ncbi:DUF998 domain-containing protein [Actinoplanes sp. N902-109]|uniref:DUF998 domain-containing protein n=1 Tax=Actinoplanes sp. (strain N902-109) TaxID=649831 RepID=UPI000684A902|nr:DUF998 domain-containing protein [Actinoplanes sp. N902-109]
MPEDHRSRTRRPGGAAGLAALAGLAVLAGASTMLVTLVAAPGSWLLGYVSEAGTAGRPLAVAYRSGLVLLAAGVALLGLALRPTSRPVAALLGVAAFLASVSGVVPCTNQCPLPPFEPTTVSDVVHTVASIIGMVVLAGVMAIVAFSSLLRPSTSARFRPDLFRPAERRLSAVAVLVTVPLGATLGLAMLLIGRGPVSAIVERLALFVAVSWLVGMAHLTLLRSSVKIEPWKERNPSHSPDRSKTESPSWSDVSPS